MLEKLKKAQIIKVFFLRLQCLFSLKQTRIFLTTTISTVLFFTVAWRAKQPLFTMLHDPLILTNLQIINLKNLFTHGAFYGIDLFTWGGSSEFFLRPNLIVYNPLFILASFIFSDHLTVYTAANLILTIFALHAFLSCFFLQKICIEFFQFDESIAAFIAIGYTFSFYVVNALPFSFFVLSAWLFPLGLYMSLSLSRAYSYSRLIYSVFVFILIYTVGYVTFSVATIFLTFLFLFFYYWYIDRQNFVGSRFLISILPICLASLIVSPLYISILDFFHLVLPTGDFGLKTTAYELAQLPSSLFRLFSVNLNINNPSCEQSSVFGMLLFTILILFISNFKRELFFSSKYFKIFNLSVILFLILLLTTFGQDTALSAIFYYFFGPVGSMHIYQRYLIFAQLFAMIAFGIMLNDIVNVSISDIFLKILILIYTLCFFVILVLVSSKIHLASVTISESYVYEFFVVILFLLSLLLYRNLATKIFAVFVLFLIQLTWMYQNSSHFENKTVLFNDLKNQEIVNFFQKNSNKPLVRYINILPNIETIIPKNYPWFFNATMGSNQKISDYYGYEPHLSSVMSYRSGAYPTTLSLARDGKNLMWVSNIDFLKYTGAEFVVYEQGSDYNDLNLIRYIDLSNSEKILKIDDKAMIAPLKFKKSHDLKFDNGYVAIYSQGQLNITKFKTNYANNIQFIISSGQSAKMQYLFWPNKNLRFYIDNKRVDPYILNQLMTVDVETGTHRIKIQYFNLSLQMFLIIYCAYFLGLIFIFIKDTVKKLAKMFLF